MRFVIQVVKNASISCESGKTGSINKGFVVLVGVGSEDTRETADKMMSKLLGLRIFKDGEGKTNLSLSDVGGALLMVSQFTLYADCRRGFRPSFINAAPPGPANGLYEYMISVARERGFIVETGVFGDHMEVSLINDGPFTIILGSDDLERKR